MQALPEHFLRAATLQKHLKEAAAARAGNKSGVNQISGQENLFNTGIGRAGIQLSGELPVAV